jgi:hypothetical protein
MAQCEVCDNDYETAFPTCDQFWLPHLHAADGTESVRLGDP